MANGCCCCSNALCIDRENQLRLARLREELLTNFNTILIDRIRFLEKTIQDNSTTDVKTDHHHHHQQQHQQHHSSSARSSAGSGLRRSSSSTTSYLLTPLDMHLADRGHPSAISCPTSAELSDNDDERRPRLCTSKKSSLKSSSTHIPTRTYSDSHSNHLSIPMDMKWSTLTHDLLPSSHVTNEKGRLESRRFACDVDDNEVRALKAMIYMEQARKQNTRPFTRLKQAFKISNHNQTGHFSFSNSKKQSNS